MHYLKKFGAEIARIAITAVVLSGAIATGQVYKWSQTAGTNASADPHINWAEGMAPSAVNDSARAMMAALAQYRDDISGSVTTGGISTAYTLATNQGLAAVPNDGQLIAFTPNVTNGAAVTLQADGGTVYPVQTSPGVAAPAATLIAGTPYTAKFSLSNTAWILRDFYGNAFGIPLGGFLHSTISTAPNANFIKPVGQCLSTTTYATYWVSLGSPASGLCPGGQFAVVNVAGRNLTALDNLSGSAANVLTSSSNGCGTAFTSMGVTCANGLESLTTTLAQLPTGITSGGTLPLNVQNILSNPNGGLTTISYQAGGTAVVQVWSNGATINNNTGVAASGTTTSSNTGGTAHPNISPNIGVYVYLRVL